MALLAVGQLHVEFFKATFSGDFALFQVAQLRFNLAHVELNLLAARARLLGQLREAQHFNLQFMRATLAFCSFAPCGSQALRCVCIGRLSPH